MQINSISNYQYSPILRNNQTTNKNITTPNFGLHNPQAAMQRALNLKALYAQQGLNYLLPNEVFSNSRIEKMANTVDLNIKKAMKKGSVTPEFVKNEINKVLPPKDRNSIIPIDLSEIPKYLKEQGATKQEIKELQKCSGLQMEIGDNKIGIFMPFKSAASPKADEYDKLTLRASLTHELTHALNAKYQNFNTASDYHLSKLDDKHFYDGYFFNKFEEKGIYPIIPDFYFLSVDKLDKEGLFKALNVKSEEELFEKFEKTLNQITKKDFHNNMKKYNTKQLFEYCKARAHDERFAYKTDKIFREYLGTKNKPIDEEYVSLLYGEAEKFFAQKAKKAPIAPEC